jgi:hypothetical protein
MSTSPPEPQGDLRARLTRRARAPITLAALAAWLYLAQTQPRELMWFDSGELALACATWGLGHPPGQPLYTLIGALAHALGGLWLLNHLSALSLIACLLGAASLWRAWGRADAHSAPEAVAAFLWVCLYPVWDQGARVELYSLAAALALWSLSFAARARPLAAGVALGLCGATNAIFAIGAGLSLIALTLTDRARRSPLSALPRLALGATAGLLLPHLYLARLALLSRGGAEAGRFVWGDLTTVEGLADYLTGADYRGTAHSDWGHLPHHAAEWLAWAHQEGALAWTLLGALGWLASPPLRQHLLTAAPLLICCGLFPLTYARYWPDVPDFTGYLLPPLALSALGVWGLLGWVRARGGRAASWGLLAALALSLCAGRSPPHARGRSAHHLPLTLARDWLGALPPRSLLVVSSDHWVFPLLYAQVVEGARPDVVVMNEGFSRSAWYWGWLRAQHPDLPRVERSPDRLRALVSAWDAPTFTETLAQAARLTPPPAPPMSAPSAPCAARWGISVGCLSPLPPPSAAHLAEWARAQSPLSPITARVLARLGADLSLARWAQGEAALALTLGYAALGLSPTPRPDVRWWPAPPALWSAARGGLIGDPEGLRAALDALSLPPAPPPPPQTPP